MEEEFEVIIWFEKIFEAMDREFIKFEHFKKKEDRETKGAIKLSEFEEIIRNDLKL